MLSACENNGRSVIRVHSVPHEKTSPMFARAFAQGCGGVVWPRSYAGGQWAGFGSPENWHDIQRVMASGQDWFYGDHAYFQRHRYYKITKNALFHKGVGKSDMKRIKMFHNKALKWVRGGKVIICPQSDAFFRLRHNTTQEDWINSVVYELQKFSDRRFVIHQKRDTKPLKECFSDTHCVIVHSSNSALEALMHGVPAICLADCVASNMARNSISDIENLMYPDNRYEWAGVLADNQFTLAEMADGTAWRKLNETV